MNVPLAQPEAARSSSRILPWSIPIIALVVVALLVWWYGRDRGPTLTIAFDDAHGLATGATLRYRGMDVGQVSGVAPTAEGVAVTVELRRDAAFLARSGSRFWIVRPEFGLTQVTGLDTVIGARYLAVRPGAGTPEKSFTGLEHRPVRPPELEGGTEFVLSAPDRGGLSPGAPVFYRQCEVGRVLAVNLARDASAVEVRVVIAPGYAGLVQPGTRFYRQGGIRVRAGLLSGVQVGVDSLAALIRGGVSFATPPGGAQPAAAGHRFALAEGPDEDWLEWAPSLRVGGSTPAVANLPLPKRASVAWTVERSIRQWWSKRVTRTAWLLPTRAGLVGPWQVLGELQQEGRKDLALEIDGERLVVTAEQIHDLGGGVGLITGLEVTAPVTARATTGIEDVVAVSDAGDPLLIAAARMQPVDGAWVVEHGVVPDAGWHGAPVVAEVDGVVIGVLSVVDGEVQVLPFDATMAARLAVK